MKKMMLVLSILGLCSFASAGNPSTSAIEEFYNCEQDCANSAHVIAQSQGWTEEQEYQAYVDCSEQYCNHP